jgi:bacteriorhodopsin
LCFPRDRGGLFFRRVPLASVRKPCATNIVALFPCRPGIPITAVNPQPPKNNPEAKTTNPMNMNLKSLVTKISIPALMVLLVPSQVHASSSVVLKSNDFVGVSFWLISMALIASTAFFFLETQRVAGKWKTSLTVSGLVTLVAAVHYFYMREVWVTTGETPTVYRYIDWLITVPLLMVEFYLILSAITKVPAGVFWRLIIGTLVMLIGGYLGEAHYMGVMPAFIIGMLGWAFILFEIFLGEAGRINASQAPPSVQSAFKLMRLIVTFGWAIYPIGYYVGYLTGSNPEESMKGLNIAYNLADVLNKIAFGVIIWTAAVSETESHKH